MQKKKLLFDIKLNIVAGIGKCKTGKELRKFLVSNVEWLEAKKSVM